MTPLLHTFDRLPSFAALAKLVRNEARLFMREPASVGWILGFPVILLVAIGSIPSSRDPSDALGGLRFIDVYVSVLITLVLAVVSLSALPTVLTNYRERGILRRLRTTPTPPRRLLVAQFAVYLGVLLTALVMVLAIGSVAFDVALPEHIAGYLLALALAVPALFAVGLLIAAVAPSTRAATAIGGLLFFPMMFFAGLWLPREMMPQALQSISDATPLGAAAGALSTATQGGWPEATNLLVLVAYAVVFGIAAARLFRWD